MEIQIKNLQKKTPLNLLRIREIVKKILRHESVTKASLAFVFVSHQKIRALNIQYLKRSYATDVLAFEGDEPYLCGDIFISTDAARKNARLYNTSVARELVLYVVHGILHLSGYDDHRPADTKRMRAKEQELMDRLGQSITRVTR